jgi:hypothetical protein
MYRTPFFATFMIAANEKYRLGRSGREVVEEEGPLLGVEEGATPLAGAPLNGE